MKTLLSKNSNVVPVLLEESYWELKFLLKIPVFVRPPQVLKILDPEQRVQLMYDYTKSRKEDAKLISFEKFISMDRIDK